ncbi:FMN reductase [Lentzea pudingi]|uniref:FMN reductase n=1 Tax=Lentzea pudingi TaxID=1789439 RepID=A0ABQ2HD57_9PSEU|nr:NAD(P)H-dependent oxidoreductase [Lentzea pudingi]GGM73474.1 FMN reductase [Lentzea pudingi]
MTEPAVVVLSGSLTPGSKADQIAGWCAKWCASRGASAKVFQGHELQFPFYAPGQGLRDRPAVKEYLDALAAADGVVLVSPAYHGTISGLLKNALDYINELAGDERPYLDGRALGCVSVALGDQGATTTVATLRTIGHALRSWPTPLAVAISGPGPFLGEDRKPASPRAQVQLPAMLSQVLELAASRTLARV